MFHRNMASFKHMKDFAYVQKKKNLDESGNVISGPRNFYAGPGKKGHFNRSVGHLFDKAPCKFMKDEYGREKMLDRVRFRP